MVEFALVLPVLLLILLGILKFGIVFNNYITLTDSVRIGARQLALSRGLPASPSDPCTLAENASSTNSQNTLSTGSITYTPSFSGPETCGNSATSWVEGDTATLRASYPCNLTFMGINFYPGCTLTAQASEAIE